AVLDSGIADHRLFEGVKIDSYNWVSDDRVKASARGHGTAVASILGGESGIAPEARLLDFRVLDAAGQGSSFDVAEAIVRAADLGADVINLSLGLYQETVHLHEAVRYAHQKGSLMVAAAGNDALTQLPFPAAYAEVLAVTAVDGNGLHAGFSNRSKGIDVAAPGVGVVVADPEGQERQINGTSAAAPFVSGTLAALLSENPGGAPENAVRLLKAQLNEAGAPGMDASYGGGLVDWDRLREREASDLQDLAVAAIHMELGSQPGTRVPVKVVVQNRGTTWIPAAQLTVVQTGEATEEFMITSLAPGAIAERTVYRHLPSAGMDAVVEMGASVALEDGTADRRPENNTRFTRFTPAKLD
ncbi:MAG: S8 family peptidase, partial [Opitutales bacterium]